MVWPASMLAKRRTLRLTRRVRNEITSMGISSQMRYQGALGTKSFRKPMPCLMKPTTTTVVKTSTVSAKVTRIWLVTVKDHGTRPMKFENSTKKKIANTKGKNANPSLPIVEWIMFATNS